MSTLNDRDLSRQEILDYMRDNTDYIDSDFVRKCKAIKLRKARLYEP